MKCEHRDCTNETTRARFCSQRCQRLEWEKRQRRANLNRPVDAEQEAREKAAMWKRALSAACDSEVTFSAMVERFGPGLAGDAVAEARRLGMRP